MNLIIKILLLSIFLSCHYGNLFSQNDNDVINSRIEYANKILLNYNENITILNEYHYDLSIWFENPDRQFKNIPIIFLAEFTEIKISVNEVYEGDNNFNYIYQLDELNRKVLEFNTLCITLKEFKTPSSEEFRNRIFEILQEINLLTFDISEKAYDFSVTCALNYKDEKYPKSLNIIKELATQSKNLILSIRNNNQEQTQDFLRMLDLAIFEYNNSLDINEMGKLLKSNLGLGALTNLNQEIYNIAFSISSWAEQYIQTEFNQDQILSLLKEIILEYNKEEGQLSSPSLFNTILSSTKKDYMLFVEEPNTFFAGRIDEAVLNFPSSFSDLPKEDIIYSNERVKLKIDTLIPIQIVDEFDKTDLNSLDGSLTNNLIILMDVSASMKKAGKLPILKKSIYHILKIMRDEDKISLIAYSGTAQVLISGADKTNKTEIHRVLSELNSSGGADLETALDSAYNIGLSNFITDGNNKLIIASDGVFGVTPSIKKIVEEKTLEGFSLSIFQYNDGRSTTSVKSLKNLTELGQGSFRTIKTDEEAIKILMEEIKMESNE